MEMVLSCATSTASAQTLHNEKLTQCRRKPNADHNRL